MRMQSTATGHLTQTRRWRQSPSRRWRPWRRAHNGAACALATRGGTPLPLGLPCRQPAAALAALVISS